MARRRALMAAGAPVIMAAMVRRRPVRSLLLLALAAVMLAAALAPAARRGVEAAAVLWDIAAGAGWSPLKATRAAPDPRPVDWRVAEETRAGDLYDPAGAARAGLVLVPGLARAGKDHPRLVALARSFQRAGVRVLIPDLPSARALRVDARNVREIAEAALHLAGRAEPGLPLGLAAISYAVGPAVLAALEPDAGARIAFVLAIGGYYDSEAAVTFLTTGAYRDGPDGAWLRREPNFLGTWVFALSNAWRLNDPRDREALAGVARRKLADPGADVGALEAGLGPEGRAVRALLVNRDPDRVPALIAGLPAPVRAEIAALDLARRDLSGLGARLLLVHGRDDPILPHTGSAALAAAAPPGRARLYLVDGLAHIELAPDAVDDILTLWRAVYGLLALFDRPDPGRAPVGK